MTMTGNAAYGSGLPNSATIIIQSTGTNGAAPFLWNGPIGGVIAPSVGQIYSPPPFAGEEMIIGDYYPIPVDDMEGPNPFLKPDHVYRPANIEDWSRKLAGCQDCPHNSIFRGSERDHLYVIKEWEIG